MPPRIKSCRVALTSIAGWGPRTLFSVSAAPDGGVIVTPRAMGYPNWTYGRLADSAFGGILPVRADTGTVSGRLAPKLHYHKSGFTSVQPQNGGERFGVQLTPIEEVHASQIFSFYAEVPGLFPYQVQRQGDILYQLDSPDFKALGVSGIIYRRSEIPDLDAELHLEGVAVSLIRGQNPVAFIDLAGYGLDSILAFLFSPLSEPIPDSPKVSLGAFQLEKLRSSGAVSISSGGPPPRLGQVAKIPTFADLRDRHNRTIVESQIASHDGISGKQPFRK